MSDFSRRDWLKTVGVAGAGALVPFDPLAVAPVAVPPPLAPVARYAPGDIVELYSTSEVFIPPRGRSFMKFSFDFPEPAVVFGNHRFGFLIFSDENTYSLDRAHMTARGDTDGIELTCDRLLGAGRRESQP